MMKIFKNMYLCLIYSFLYIPIMILIIFSFNDATYSVSWHGGTLKWYQQLITDHEIWITAGHSLLLALSAATIVTILGTIAAINLFRYRFYGRRLMHGLLFALLIVPDIVLAIAFLVLFNTMHLPLGFFSLLLAHITFCLPFVTLTVHTSLCSLDQNLFDVAKDLGANEFTLIRGIIIPLVWPALAAGWLLSFTLSLDDVMISYFVTGAEFDILPLKIFSLARTGIKPDLSALCSLMFCFSLLLVVTAYRVLNKKRH